MQRLFAMLLACTFAVTTVAQNYTFRGDTPILMADGTQKAIEQLHKGDCVMSYDTITGQLTVQRIKKLIHTQPLELMRMGYRTEGTDTMLSLFCVEGLPLLTPQGQFVTLSTLMPTQPLVYFAQGEKEACTAHLVLPKVAIKGGKIAQRIGIAKTYTLQLRSGNTIVAGGLVVPAAPRKPSLFKRIFRSL